MTDPTWYQLVEHFGKKLELEKDRLTGKDTTRDEDLYTKGRIAAFKELLSFKRTLETRLASSAREI